MSLITCFNINPNIFDSDTLLRMIWWWDKSLKNTKHVIFLYYGATRDTCIIMYYNNNNIYLKSNIHKMFSKLLYNTHIKYSIK